MDPDLDPGLFGIQLSDSEDGSNDSEPAEGTRPKKGEASTPVDRTAQSEEEFQAVRRGYRVKVENGEVRILIFLLTLARAHYLLYIKVQIP